MPIWSLSERGRYCVSTPTRVMPEFTQLLRAKSMMRYRPPKITAGFARSSLSTLKRSPWPPARIRATTRFMVAPRSAGYAFANARLRYRQAPELAEDPEVVSQIARREEIGPHVLDTPRPHGIGFNGIPEQ